ncbi:peptide deformylase [Nonomuraea ferruginea]
MLARCLQHETDHLDGHLYIDRLPAKRRKQVLAAYEQSLATGQIPTNNPPGT